MHLGGPHIPQVLEMTAKSRGEAGLNHGGAIFRGSPMEEGAHVLAREGSAGICQISRTMENDGQASQAQGQA